MLKPNRLFLTILAGLSVLLWTPAFVYEPAITIQIVTTFDYPGAGNSTTPHFINSHGDIAGTYVTRAG